MSRRFDDQTLLGFDGDATGGIELGTVGWEDGKEHFDLGTAENDGNTLVKVTLFRGRSPLDPEANTSARARGAQILCRISGPLWYIPADGAQVLVAVPARFSMVPGAPMIIAVPGPNPATQFGTGGAGKNVLLDFGPDRRVIIKAGQGVILSDYDDRFLGVGPALGVKAGDASGSGFQLDAREWKFYITDGATIPDAKAVLQLSEDSYLFTHKSPSGDVCAFKFKNGNCTLATKELSAMCSNAKIGAAASPATPVQYGVGTGTPSTSIWVQS